MVSGMGDKYHQLPLVGATSGTYEVRLVVAPTRCDWEGLTSALSVKNVVILCFTREGDIVQ